MIEVNSKKKKRMIARSKLELFDCGNKCVIQKVPERPVDIVKRIFNELVSETPKDLLAKELW